MRGIKSPQKENHSRFGTHTQVNRRILFYFVFFPIFFQPFIIIFGFITPLASLA
jgi:hypothetical protein